MITPSPASLWPRAGAFLLDYLPISVWLAVTVAIGALLRSTAPAVSNSVFQNPFLAQVVGFVLITVPVSLYFAISESGPRGATWGKRRMGIRVVTNDGARLSTGRALLRTALKFLPWELAHGVVWQMILPGFLPEAIAVVGLVAVWALVGANLVSALLDSQHRTLYDRWSRTHVIRFGSS